MLTFGQELGHKYCGCGYEYPKNKSIQEILKMNKMKYVNKYELQMGMEGSYWVSSIILFNHHEKCFHEIPKFNEYVKDKLNGKEYVEDDLMELYLSCLDGDLENFKKYFSKNLDYNLRFVLELLRYRGKSISCPKPYNEPLDKNSDGIYEFLYQNGVDINLDNVLILFYLNCYQFNDVVKYSGIRKTQFVYSNFLDIYEYELDIHDKQFCIYKKYNNEYCDMVKYLYENNMLEMTRDELFSISYLNPDLIMYFINKGFNYRDCKNFMSLMKQEICGGNLGFREYQLPDIHDKYYMLQDVQNNLLFDMTSALRNRNIDVIRELIKNSSVFDREFYEHMFTYDKILYTRYFGENISRLLLNKFIDLDFTPNSTIVKFFGKKYEDYENYFSRHLCETIKRCSTEFFNTQMYKLMYQYEIFHCDVRKIIFSYLPRIGDLELVKKFYSSEFNDIIINVLKSSIYCDRRDIFYYLFDKFDSHQQIDIFDKLLYKKFSGYGWCSVIHKNESEMYIEIVNKYPELKITYNTFVIVICNSFVNNEMILRLLSICKLTQSEMDSLINLFYDSPKIFDYLLDRGANPFNSDHVLDLYILLDGTTEISTDYIDKIDLKKCIENRKNSKDKLFKAYSREPRFLNNLEKIDN